MKPLNFIVIKLTVCLILGILLSYLLSIKLIHSLYFTTIAFAIFSINYFIAKQQFQKTVWFGISTYGLMICLGALIFNFHNQKNFATHYTKSLNLEQNELQTMTFRIDERLKPSLYHDKYVVNLIKVDDKTATGKLVLNIEKDSLNRNYQVDDLLFTYSEFQPIHHPLNPYQFNYKAYLEKQYIYHQVSTQSASILKLKSETRTLSGLAASLRELINIRLNEFDFKPSELAIINAILLGQRQDMGKATYNNYVNAGAIHILAVSGLHVGIILLLLNILLKPIEQVKYGKFAKVCLIIFLLWSFAIIAGLSASVTRAVTMFSIVAIAMNLKRPTNIYNTLAFSVFIVLLFKPMFLFDVGFQMSYLAVIAIVSIQPLLYKLWKPKWKVIDYFWQIFTVTIAAQFGVVPISLYYFHQFPGLFFLSNLAIIPFLGLILGFGILVVILALINALPEYLANLYGTIINLMNSVINWVAQQDFFLLQYISFDMEHVLACYIIIITSILFWKKKNFKSLIVFLMSILIVQGAWTYSKYKNDNHSFTIFHKNRYSILGYKVNSELEVSHNLDSITALKDRVISNYSIGNFIDNIEIDSIRSVYQFQNKTILIIDSLGVYNVKLFRPDYVLIRNSPRINLERVIDSIHPKQIIADGSNYTSYIKRWEATCLKRKLPFHYTGKKGAFIIK
nr:ComEC/Rec2 family competence protein [uncultured Psychroserpens sp.]